MELQLVTILVSLVTRVVMVVIQPRVRVVLVVSVLVPRRNVLQLQFTAVKVKDTYLHCNELSLRCSEVYNKH